MAFKSEKQRKAFFAMRYRNNYRAPRFYRLKNAPMAHKTDTDKDGIPDKYDSNPTDPKKQSILLDIQKKYLRRREEVLEKKREAEQRKLEDLKDRLKEKIAVRTAKNKKYEERQAVIDEINKEKEQLKKLREENKKAKQMLFDESLIGRGIKKSQSVINRTKAYFNKSENRRKFKSIQRSLGSTAVRKKAHKKRFSHAKKRTIKKKKRREPLPFPG